MAKNWSKFPFRGTTLSTYKSGLKGSFWPLSVPKISVWQYSGGQAILERVTINFVSKMGQSDGFHDNFSNGHHSRLSLQTVIFLLTTFACQLFKQFDILVKGGETVTFHCIVYKQTNFLRKCGVTVRFALMYVYLQTNFFLVLFYTNLSNLAESNFSSL